MTETGRWPLVHRPPWSTDLTWTTHTRVHKVRVDDVDIDGEDDDDHDMEK